VLGLALPGVCVVPGVDWLGDVLLGVWLLVLPEGLGEELCAHAAVVMASAPVTNKLVIVLFFMNSSKIDMSAGFNV
jgi:hypothetical protein